MYIRTTDTLRAYQNMHGFPSFVMELHDDSYDARSTQLFFLIIYLYSFTFSASIVYTFCKVEL